MNKPDEALACESTQRPAACVAGDYEVTARRHARGLSADGLRVVFTTRGYVRVSSEQEYELFRIAQEALRNIARQLSARLRFANQTIEALR